jgi:phosphomannomutase
MLAIGGLRFTLKDEWGLMGASGIESLVRLTPEGECLWTAKEIMDESTRLFRERIKEKRR